VDHERQRDEARNGRARYSGHNNPRLVPDLAESGTVRCSSVDTELPPAFPPSASPLLCEDVDLPCGKALAPERKKHAVQLDAAFARNETEIENRGLV